jgi:taurine dioxygenase
MAIEIEPLTHDLRFGSRVKGLVRPLLLDAGVRERLCTLFEERGLIVFEDIEPSAEMHVALSNVFGPLKDHAVAAVARVDQNAMPGVIDMDRRPDDSAIVEIDGQAMIGWLPWHFDHCYNDELNRAGVLRAIETPPEGGLTCFCDGIDLYQKLSPDLREKIEGRGVLYRLNLLYEQMRFGLPESFRKLHTPAKQHEITESSQALPRAVHPAVWVRKSGEKVLHVSPWMALGIEGEETAAGDALLSAVCQEINRNTGVYRHQWRPTDMVIWDNWRMLHSVTGADPRYPRRMQRTTIKGDYGLGYFEGSASGGALLEMTV